MLCLLALPLLFGCDGITASTDPAATLQPGSPATLNSKLTVGTPMQGTVSRPAVLMLNPDHGKPGTRILVMGTSFPENSFIEIRLSGLNSGASETIYATFHTDGTGTVHDSFYMPERWPSGDLILLPQVVVVASTPDFLSKATALFSLDTSNSPVPPKAQNPK